jgi:hypothetical protein
MTAVLAMSVNTFWAIVANAMVIGGAVIPIVFLPLLIKMIPHRDPGQTRRY